MDGSTEVDEEGKPQGPTVASILGIRGPLRFRTHGSTQKAHVVLRQVELSEESGDEGDDSSMVYFSLFAQKRIEVKPGKEILLAVASPDGRVIDTPVIIAGSLVDKKVQERPELPAKPVVEDLPATPAVYTMPPRMRKAWPGQVGVGQSGSGFPQFPPSKCISYNSTGVQCEIPTISRAVETEPEPVRSLVSSAVQAVEPPRVTYAKDTQTDVPMVSYKESTAQTIPEAPPPARTAVASQTSPEEMKTKVATAERERSLSPMELDSPPSSPTLSLANAPSKSPTPSEERAKSASYSPRTFSPPELSVSTTDPSQRSPVDVRISPLHLSPDSGDAPGLIVTPEAIAFQKTFAPPVDRDNLRLPPAKESIQPQASSQEVKPSLSFATYVPPVFSAQFPPPMRPLTPPPQYVPLTPVVIPATPAPPTEEPPSLPIEPAPYVPKRKAVPNPFVSGGYISDFVGISTQRVQTPKSVESPRTPEQKKSEPVVPLPNVKPASNTTPTPIPAPPSISPPPPPPPQARSRPDSPRSNLAASTSRVKVEDIPPNGIVEEEDRSPSRLNSAEHEPSPTAPKARAAQPQQPSILQSFHPSLSPYPPYAPRGAPGAIPAVPARAPHPSLTATFPAALHPWAHSRERSPPPDPKSLAYIPTGSYSNPLNIKPAKTTAPTPAVGHPVPSGPAAMKKPVVVGNGWPYNTRSQARAAAAAAANNGVARPQPTTAKIEPNNNPPPPTPLPQPASPSTPVPQSASPPTSSQNARPVSNPSVNTTPQQVPPTPSVPVKPQQHLRVSLSGVTSYQTMYPPNPPQASAPRQTPTPTSTTTPTHPLPPKPPAFTGTAAGSYSPRRGVKRMVSPSPVVPEQKQKAGFAWPTGDPTHTVRIKGDDDVGIRSITFNSDGTQFAVACFDKSVRIWNCRTRQEIAKLAHTMQVLAIAWMDHDSGVITLGDNGILSTWTRNAQNKWQWAKLLDINMGRQSRESPSCLAFVRDRIAIALPTEGVKVWTFMKGAWIPQRSIGRQKVTAIKFVDDGDALVGGTEDGTLWHCEVPNGTLKALKIFTKTPISTLDTDARGQLGLAALADGRCELVNIRLDDRKGSVEQVYSVKDMEMPGNVSYSFGAMFVNRGQAVLHGTVRGCVMVWDRSNGDVFYGLRHAGEDDVIQTVSCFNGTPNLAGMILTGTRNGQLTWFAQPPTDAGPQTRKRTKIN